MFFLSMDGASLLLSSCASLQSSGNFFADFSLTGRETSPFEPYLNTRYRFPFELLK